MEKFLLLKEELKRILVVQSETYVSYLKMYKKSEKTYQMYRTQKNDYDKIKQVSNLVKGTSNKQVELKKLVEKILREYNSEDVIESFLYQEASLEEVIKEMKEALEQMLRGIVVTITALSDAGKGYRFEETEWKRVRGVVIVYICKSGDYNGRASFYKNTWDNISSDTEFKKALEESDSTWFKEESKKYLI